MATPTSLANNANGGSSSSNLVINGRSGYCAATKSFHSLRPPVPLPPPDVPLSFPAFAFSLLRRSLSGDLPPALLDSASGEAVTFPAFVSRVRALAGKLRARVGVRRGDVAFVLTPARLDVPVLYFALLSVGAVVAPANPALTPSEVSRLVSLSGASFAFAVSSTAGKLPAAAGLAATVLLDSPRFRSLMTEEVEEQHEEAVELVRQSDTAAIQFSSGTTGRVKAAALPHRNFIAMVAGFHALKPSNPNHHQRVLLCAPMFHSMGFIFVLNGIALGSTTVLVTANPAGIRGLVEAAERWAVTEMTAAPPVVMAMAKESSSSRRLPALERIICGGAPLPTPVIDQFRRRFPHVDLCMGYGSTEGGGISRMINKEECTHIGSAGRITENLEVKIVDHVTSKPLVAGQQGELWVRGPTVMKGYVSDDEANAITFDSEGWLKTGDICYIDQDGFLFVVDRLKELIKYKAYQVPPAELELVLQSLPEIVDAAVIPYPHEEAGQIPMALVVKQSGSKLTEAEIMNNVAKQVAPYKKIRKVVFVESIPKSPSGKILRRELANHLRLCKSSRL
uniref:4-coumarate--CoA ligase n=1 Tax=Leersia perrieri TaxID=77586 RepID=A0A0D9XR81_9ORYZ